MSNRKIKVGFFGDSRPILDALCSALNKEPDIVCSAVSPSGHWTKQPDILLLDCKDATEANLKQLSVTAPNVKLVVMNADGPNLDEACCVRYGVSGFTLKSALLSNVASTIRKVMEGSRILPESVTARLVEQIYESRNNGFAPNQNGDLTSKERQVMQLIAEGLCNQDISERLCISLPTVKAHIQNIFRKLGCHRRAQVIRLCLERKPTSVELRPENELQDRKD